MGQWVAGARTEIRCHRWGRLASALVVAAGTADVTGGELEAAVGGTDVVEGAALVATWDPDINRNAW